MLNSKKVMTRQPRDMKLSDYGLAWKNVADEIMDFHSLLAHRFHTGVGLQLQRIDSSIAERVLMQFALYGIPILPVHDSFIVQDSFEAALRITMNDEFGVVVQRSPDLKLSSRNSSQIVHAPIVDLETFDRLMNQKLSPIFDGSTSGHQRRLEAFNLLKAHN